MSQEMIASIIADAFWEMEGGEGPRPHEVSAGDMQIAWKLMRDPRVTIWSALTLEQVELPEPFIGPPKPWACVEGWHSHAWTCDIEEGNLSFETKECRLCNDGIKELEQEYLSGSFPAKLEFHKETFGYETPETDVWWEVIPCPVTE